ncbi:hypothetical protein DPMN_006632 [Dreissena polymorpha]|uniref:Uncharacterized protein n=1 Tax=Dreissena polymorpha TaxID=45954 RepID=A0A9D4RXM9_DREPO|nr:hypothetical protein DPMN_006632 [Dreissena polymorpha]
MKDIKVGNTFLTDKYCQKCIKSIADTYWVDQDIFLKESPFIAIISDGSTDTALKKAEIVFVRAAAKGEVERVRDTYCFYILLYVDKRDNMFPAPILL